jgi:hypothetical protein
VSQPLAPFDLVDVLASLNVAQEGEDDVIAFVDGIRQRAMDRAVPIHGLAVPW